MRRSKRKAPMILAVQSAPPAPAPVGARAPDRAPAARPRGEDPVDLGLEDFERAASAWLARGGHAVERRAAEETSPICKPPLAACRAWSGASSKAARKTR